MSLLYPLALPSLLSSGSVIDRLQQLRPPTALSSFGDTLSVLIRALIGRLAVAEGDQGLGHRDDNDFPRDTICGFPFCLSVHPLFYSFFNLLPALMSGSFSLPGPQILSHKSMFVLICVFNFYLPTICQLREIQERSVTRRLKWSVLMASLIQQTSPQGIT